MRLTQHTLLFAYLIAVAMATPAPTLRAQPSPPIAAVLQEPPFGLVRAGRERLLPSVARVYRDGAYEPFWTVGAPSATSSAMTPAGAQLVDALRRAPEHGLELADYLVPEIDSLQRVGTTDALALLDVTLSLHAVRFAQDLGWGIVLPAESDRSNAYGARPFHGDSVLRKVRAATDPGAALLAYASTSPAYGYLKQTLALLRSIEARGGWTTASGGPALRMGDRSARVAELRQLLNERQDIDPRRASGDSFDLDVAQALVRFQRRHGLTPDTVYGRDAVREMNVPVSERIVQVRLGLERLRWLPPLEGGRSIAVNLADFRVYLVDDGRITFEAATVIGTPFHKTPMFTDTMTYIAINPYWNVPTSIARNEILPKLRKDPTYLARNHMERRDGLIRQLPGDWNSLGRFKFMFPNAHNVYLHDTPAKSLFSETERTFSHGCIRVEGAGQLALLMLAPQGWTQARIDSALATGTQVIVNLEVPIPVRITYVTAFMGPDAILNFRRDVYGRDQTLRAALAKRRAGTWEL